MEGRQDLLGRTLSGRFRVTGFIGEGAMANVYRAEDLGAAEPRDVAVKIMHPHLTADRTFVSRFRREAKAAQKLDHPCSVKVIEHGVDDGVVYIVMELLAGQDLFETLVLERRLSEARAARILIQICDALSAAHAQGIVHRDLKPENIMLLEGSERSGTPRVKVLDFGIAKLLERETPERGEDGATSSGPASSMAMSVLTTVGVVVGTPAYMSPEQCRGDAIDARADIYSCGVLLYQLVTGRLPFSGSTPVEIAVAQLQQAPAAPSTFAALHPALEATILSALSKWPAQRQQSADELKRELEQMLPELSETVEAPPAAAGPAIATLRQPTEETEEITTTLASRVTEAPALPRDPTPEPTRRSAVAPPVDAPSAELAHPPTEPDAQLVATPVAPARASRFPPAAMTGLVVAGALLLGALSGAVAFWLSH